MGNEIGSLDGRIIELSIHSSGFSNSLPPPHLKFHSSRETGSFKNNLTITTAIIIIAIMVISL